MQSVLKVLAESPAQKKLLVLDIGWPVEDAYWGRLDVGVAARVPEELAAVPDPSRLVLCSCSAGQTPLAAPEWNRSAFGYFLEEGLRGWADFDKSNPERQGLVTAKKLASYVQSRVEHWAKLHGDAPQTPILYGEAADFPLVALAKGKPISHQEPATAGKYPEWLVEAWKTRDRWRTEERYRFAPWLFRQTEEAIIHADRNWAYGADSGALQEGIAKRNRTPGQVLSSASRFRPDRIRCRLRGIPRVEKPLLPRSSLQSRTCSKKFVRHVALQ